jgi:hypothetical protein
MISLSRLWIGTLSRLWIGTAGFIIGTVIYRALLSHSDYRWDGFADTCFGSIGLAIALTVIAWTL